MIGCCVFRPNTSNSSDVNPAPQAGCAGCTRRCSRRSRIRNATILKRAIAAKSRSAVCNCRRSAIEGVRHLNHSSRLYETLRSANGWHIARHTLEPAQSPLCLDRTATTMLKDQPQAVPPLPKRGRHYICPAGQKSVEWRPHLDIHGNSVVTIRFSPKSCGKCLSREPCFPHQVWVNNPCVVASRCDPKSNMPLSPVACAPVAYAARALLDKSRCI